MILIITVTSSLTKHWNKDSLRVREYINPLFSMYLFQCLVVFNTAMLAFPNNNTRFERKFVLFGRNGHFVNEEACYMII